MIEQLVGRVFLTRDKAHLAHWSSTKYSEHMALGSFYEDIISSTDSLIENYQAIFGLIEGQVKPKDLNEECDILSCLQEDVKWIKKNYVTITQGLSPLQNLLDNLSSVYLKTIYKLENLN